MRGAGTWGSVSGALYGSAMGYTADERLAAGPEESRYLGAVFTLGAQVGTHAEDPARPVYVVEVAEVSPIRVPSGRLVVASPWPDDSDWELPTPAGRELKDRILPGVHRVQVSWTEAPFEYNGEQFDGREAVAVRLLVSDAPVVCWEAGLGVGESIEQIVHGERPGFDSEENMGSFADATAWPSLTEPFRQFWLEVDAGKQDASRATESLGESFERVSDEALGADLVTFPADGGSVVWLGRTETGSIASIVTTNTPAFHNRLFTAV
jgi:Protein of unknown function (DUF4241)